MRTPGNPQSATLKKEREYIERLERRRVWLLQRITSNEKPGALSYDQAEVAALAFAIRVLRNAEEQGILHDLAAVTR